MFFLLSLFAAKLRGILIVVRNTGMERRFDREHYQRKDLEYPVARDEALRGEVHTTNKLQALK